MKCRRCGSQGGIEVTITKRSKGCVAAGVICRPCMKRAHTGHEILRAEFTMLCELGLSKEVANYVMCMRVDQFFAVHALYGSSA